MKSIEDVVRHDCAWLVETMPMALQTHAVIWQLIGKAWPQGRVWPASIIVR
jgi:hypothetical protein